MSTRRVLAESSGSSLLIICLALLGSVLLGLLGFMALRRYRLEQKRHAMQNLMDEAVLQASQQNGSGLHEALVAHLHANNANLNLTTMSTNTNNPTAIEHVVVGSSESDDFVIMGAGKPPRPIASMASRKPPPGTTTTSSQVLLKTSSTASSMASQHHYTNSSIVEEPSLGMASSVASDDTIIIMQSTRGGSSDSFDYVLKTKTGPRHV
ncbi:hypothetical protein SDRG_13365 [Saprolegnia diclina VS20]|uniref:Uncharacterized protein n=1 Tax=Saprolegnia diclina (strain VS20) TaxID=1156394 RepID=T0R9P7_SAPDV|nr:hypothetical protein SDRG_13365 [Saprolegnia diclina VS20]EQC28853.1 hypothetical protein SDRG_13365 [Saprolegnia diclina VS20]|eukprot:XP_008617670.1 hypothetical protein SDRG_13365 [Saprolegnia diclina VS20]